MGIRGFHSWEWTGTGIPAHPCCLPGTKRLQLGLNYGAHNLENCILMIFLFLGSSLAHLEPKLQLFEVLEMMVRQIIIACIAMVINFKQL